MKGGSMLRIFVLVLTASIMGCIAGSGDAPTKEPDPPRPRLLKYPPTFSDKNTGLFSVSVTSKEIPALRFMATSNKFDAPQVKIPQKDSPCSGPGLYDWLHVVCDDNGNVATLDSSKEGKHYFTFELGTTGAPRPDFHLVVIFDFPTEVEQNVSVFFYQQLIEDNSYAFPCRNRDGSIARDPTGLTNYDVFCPRIWRVSYP